MLGNLNLYLIRVTVFLLPAALIVGMSGFDCSCTDRIPPSQNLEIRNWYDLDQVRHNLAGSHTLMNDLDSSTPGYEELAGPTANSGRGWQAIGWGYWGGPRSLGGCFRGAFDGQGHEIRDLFLFSNGWGGGGLFGCVGKGGTIKNLGVIAAIATLPEDLDEFVTLDRDTVAFVSPLITCGILAGLNMGSVSYSYAAGAVSGDGPVGGLIGTNTGTVSNCYSTADVAGSAWGTGGLVGSNGQRQLRYSGRVANCYSTGSVTARGVPGYEHEHVGGLVGVNSRGSVRNSFWDFEASGQAASDGGVGRTTAEMKSIATFSGARWNIVAVTSGELDTGYTWNIVDGQTYPFLSWQAVSQSRSSLGDSAKAPVRSGTGSHDCPVCSARVTDG